MNNHTAIKNWCANKLVGATWACGDDNHKENFEVVNTCTGPGDDKSLENYGNAPPVYNGRDLTDNCQSFDN